MVVAPVVAVLGLLVVAASARPGDGRVETAVALPLGAAAAVWSPPVAPALLAGAGLAYLALAVLEARTLLFGRRLRAIAALVGATVPLGTLAGAVALGVALPSPELWLAGSVVPGVLAYDLRRQPARRRLPIGVGGATVFASLAVTGVVLRATVAAAPIDRAVLTPAGSAPAAPLTILAPVVLLGIAAGAVLRWRYGLHAGLLSVPLLAVWTVESRRVFLAYLAAGLAATFVVAVVQPRLRSPGRRLAAAAGLVGATVGAVASVLGAPELPALLAGVLAAEDARLLRGHAGTDLRDALALGGGLFALLTAPLAVGIGVTGGWWFPTVGAVGVAGLVLVVRVVVRRERARPAEERLRVAERRWVP